MGPHGSRNPNSTAWPTIILTGIIADIPDSLMSTVRLWISSPLRLWIRRGTPKLNLECPRWSLGNRLAISCPCYRMIKWHTPLRTNRRYCTSKATRKFFENAETVLDPSVRFIPSADMSLKTSRRLVGPTSEIGTKQSAKRWRCCGGGLLNCSQRARLSWPSPTRILRGTEWLPTTNALARGPKLEY